MQSHSVLFPDNILALVIVGLGLALMLNLVRPGWVFGALGWLIGLLLLSPFIAPLMGALPFWVLALLLVFLSFFSLRMVLELLIGKEGAGSFMGRLTWELFSAPFRFAKFLLVKIRGG